MPSDRDLDTSNSKVNLAIQKEFAPHPPVSDRSLFAPTPFRQSDLSIPNKDSSNQNSGHSINSIFNKQDDTQKLFSPTKAESRVGDPPALQPYYKLVKTEVD